MKKSAFFVAALCLGALLLGSCHDNQPADATATEMAPAATGSMAGMDQAHMAGDAASTSPLLASMNSMMANMDAVKVTGNTDHDFARMMLEHHKGAVVMADIELRDGKDATMRQLAEKIKANQRQEINELTASAKRLESTPANYNPQDPSDPFAARLKSSMGSMMNDMPALVADPDMNFNRLMAVHHQSAVAMARAEVVYGKDKQLKKLAQLMVDAQQQEIQQFKEWRARNADKMN